jgi:hypothetical protein
MTPTSAPGTDLQPISLVVGSIVRRAWVIGTVTALVAAAAWIGFGLGQDATDDRTATTRVGVTTAVVWPYFDVARERARALVESPEFETQLESELGYPVEGISTAVPDMLSVFDISVVADTADHAVEAADRAADLIVDIGIERQSADTEAQIAALDQQIAELDTTVNTAQAAVDAANQRLSEIAEQQAAEFDQVLQEENFAIAMQRDVDQARLIDSDRERTGKINARRTLSEAAPAAAEYEVLPRTADPRTSTSPRLPLTLALAFVALIVSSVVVVIWDRRRGLLRHPWQLRQVCGAPAVDSLVADDEPAQQTAALADRIHVARARGASVFGVVDATGRGMSAEALAQGLSDQGIACVVADEPITDPDALVTLVDVTDEHGSAQATRTRTRDCDGVVLLVDGATTIATAKALVQRCSLTPGIVSSLMVVDR